MMRRTLGMLMVFLAPALLPAPVALARTLDYAFLPPQVEQQDLCGARQKRKPDELTIGQRDDRLTDKERIRLLTRDINRYQSADPDRHFVFVSALIDRLEALDEDFDAADATLARIALHIDAGRFAAVTDAGLVAQLIAARDTLNNAQIMRVAQLLLNGLGGETDEALAYEMIREAGLSGNADALLYLARRMLDDAPVEGWDAPADLTVTMAFGGLLGQMNGGVCGRALRIAEEYMAGGVVSRNPDIALAWYRFAADLGSAKAAWRVVEHHLTAPAEMRDPEEFHHYLERAVDRGITLTEAALAQIRAGGPMDAGTLRALIGDNHAASFDRYRPDITRYLELSVNIDSQETSAGGPYLAYLREVSQLPGAPGAVFTEIAKEILVRRGRWAGEDEAMPFLIEAARRDDAEGMRLLAERLIRYRRDPAKINQAVDLLTDAGTRMNAADALNDLDTLFRCQAPDAPRLQEADHWARAFKATGRDGISISASDLVALDPLKDPWTLAELQVQALERNPGSLSKFLQLVQIDPLATGPVQRAWADRADNSDKTMEEFAKLEFELNSSPAERRAAVEFFRRVYLNNGVTTALDLAIALTEDDGRNAEIADEVLRLLEQSGNRGEGASIRLLARLLGPDTPEAEIFARFAETIEERGDFLALMFALPHVAEAKREDYFDRAIALMTCNSKDIAELAEARARAGEAEAAYRWREIGLTFDAGHVLSKLRLSDRQMRDFRRGAAPSAATLAARPLRDAARDKHRFRLTANPRLDSFDADMAAALFEALAEDGDPDWALNQYLAAPQPVQARIAGRGGALALLREAAEAGLPPGMESYATALRLNGDLAGYIEWTLRAAKTGRTAPMADLGQMLAMGAGVERDIMEAEKWLDKASKAGHQKAGHLLQLLRSGGIR